MKSCIFIPIEIQAREALSRTLLAHRCVRKDVDVFLGEQSTVVKHAKKIGQGVFFDKSLSQVKATLFGELKREGLSVASIDEEGLCHENNAYLYNHFRVSEKTVSLADVICTWGESEKKRLLELFGPKNEKKIHSCGNSRLDLLKPEFRSLVNSGKVSKPSQYTLITSNCSVNNANGFGFLQKQANMYGWLRCDKAREDYARRHHYRYITWFKFAEAIKNLILDHPQETFVIRPHPSENHEFWPDFIGNSENCRIIYDSHYTEWLVHADRVIHSSCTSGLFAWIANIPSMSFLPSKSDPYSHFIANRTGLVAQNYPELKDGFSKMKSCLVEASIQNDVKNYVLLDDRLASERISDLLVQESRKNSQSKMNQTASPPPIITPERRSLKERFHPFAKREAKPVALRNKDQRTPEDQKLNYSNEYNQQCFGGLEVEDVESSIDKLNQKNPDRVSVNTTLIGANLFKLCSDQI